MHSRPDERRRVLVVVHQEHSTPGRVGEMLNARGFVLDRRCPNLGDPLPEDLTPYAAAVVFGGPQSANDDHLRGIRAELEWLERCALPQGGPLLGICLGAQEIARVLGARVGPREDGRVEIGYKRVSPTAQGRGLFAGPTCFYEWHSQGFTIPEGAVHLARSVDFPGQAFRYGRSVWAIEFHPEITRQMIERWCTSERGSAKLTLPGAQSMARQLQGFDRYASGSDAWLARFLDHHLLPGARPVPAAGLAASAAPAQG